jgi:hypothetical protein
MSPRNYFRENRLDVLKGIEESGFLTPLTQADLPLCISENSKTSSLKEVVIENVPADDEDGIRPRSWVLDLEMPKPVFGSIQHTKTAEKALIVLGSDALRIFMFELKSSLQPYGDSSLDTIKTKMEHTIARISMLLPIQIFGSEFNDIDILYKGIICYDQDNAIVTSANTDADFARNTMYKAFTERKKMLTLSDVFGRTHPVELLFFKNPHPNQVPFQIEFEDLFFADSAEWEVPAASNGEMTCPITPHLPRVE